MNSMRERVGRLLTVIGILQASLVVMSLTSNVPTQHQSSCPSKIHKVAIIGCGVAGLSLAHALTNSPSLMKGGDASVQVTLFDARKTLNFEAGAGVQLNGGMSVLRKINPDVQRAVADAGLSMTKIRSRARHWGGGGAAFDELLSIDTPGVAHEMGGDAEQELIVNGESMFYTIMRGALQEALLESLPANVRRGVQFGKCLTNIRAGDGGEIEVGFQDGTSVEGFDMVIGCDGIKTAVKEYIDTGAISEDPARQGSSAVYSGIRIRYAVQDGDASAKKEEVRAELRQYFGEGAYALSGIYGAGATRPPTRAAFTIFLDDAYIGPFKKKESIQIGSISENADWSQDVRTPESNRDRMLQQIKNCEIPELDVGPVVSNADRFFELGVYFHNPFSFGGWSTEVPKTDGRYCVLCGDAAHAMPPFLGQGSNQAIQDAYLLAKQIHQYNAVAATATTENESPDLAPLLKEYERIRWAATTSISAKAALLGYLEASSGLLAKFRDVFFRTLGALGVAKRVYLDAATPKLK